MDRLDLTGLIAARMCHDLAGPVSALTSGTELLADETDAAVRAEFTALLGEGAARLASSLRFYRLVFGGGGAGVPVPLDEAIAVLADFLGPKSRIDARWRANETALPRLEARLALALALVGADALPRHGGLLVMYEPQEMTIAATGVAVALASEQAAALAGTPIDEPGSRAAAAHFAAALAARLGRTIVCAQEEGWLQLSAH